MWFTTTLSLFAVILAFFSQFRSKAKYFEFGFILLTVTASLQYYYGTDYMRYYEMWERYRLYNIIDNPDNLLSPSEYSEPGWILLNNFLGFEYGFFVLVALISIIENYIYYRFIKDYVPVKWRWLAVFLYVGMDNLYLLNFSMLRQGLCVSLFVAAVMLMNKRKIISAIVVIFFL